MDELKPCPFCGGEAELSKSGLRFAFCVECYAKTDHMKTLDDAAKAWNKRSHHYTPHKASDLYALYHGDELQAVGTAHELADFMGVKLETFYWYTYPSAQKRCRNAKEPRYYVERIEE